jgi:predicted membrane protein
MLNIYMEYMESPEENKKTLTVFLGSFVLFYFAIEPYSLRYYFHTHLGRVLLLLFSLLITSICPLFGISCTLVLLILYHYTIFREGMTNQMKKKDKKKAEGFTNMKNSLNPSRYGNERNVVLTMETYMRPKSSNTIPI